MIDRTIKVATYISGTLTLNLGEFFEYVTYTTTLRNESVKNYYVIITS